ncbi:MAG TPA: metal-dependent transcriptional regulator [Acidobacteriaceae bacterium]
MWVETMPDVRRSTRNSESVDNYLKAILFLGGTEERRVTSSSLADRLEVAPASVTNMLQKLAGAAEPMVEYERHRGVKLSPTGKRRALEVVRHHRLIETFLFEILDYPIDEVHDEAERLEHFISERFEERIAAKLGYPTSDPHGHTIPTLSGEMQEPESIPLTDVAGEGSYLIASVSDEDGEKLRQLKTIGIAPGAFVHVKKRDAMAGYWLRVGHSLELVELAPEIAREIRIAPEPQPDFPA